MPLGGAGVGEEPEEGAQEDEERGGVLEGLVAAAEDEHVDEHHRRHLGRLGEHQGGEGDEVEGRVLRDRRDVVGERADGILPEGRGVREALRVARPRLRQRREEQREQQRREARRG